MKRFNSKNGNDYESIRVRTRHSNTGQLFKAIIIILMMFVAFSFLAIGFNSGLSHNNSLNQTTNPKADVQIWGGSGDVANSLSGSGDSEADPYLISSGADLAFLAQEVNLGNTDYSSSKFYKLTNDIYLNDTTQNGGWENWGTDGSNLNEWTAIGNVTNKFQANFDGNGFSVFGIFIESVDDRKGLFGYVNGAIISNLGVKKSYIKGKNNVGGIVGHASVSIITDCFNTGGVIATEDNAGGIAGCADWSSVINNCYNTGTIQCGSLYAGGIVGDNNGSTIKDCYNSASVSGNKNVSGIAGKANGGKVINCYNTASVTGTSDNVGGVVGIAHSVVEIIDCYNSASVTSSGDYVGGIVGVAETEVSVVNCYNTGSVNGARFVGGVVAFADWTDIINCYNSGAVTGTGLFFGQYFFDNVYVGGVIGSANGSSVANCYNTSNVMGINYVGGVVGGVSNNTISNCYNIGDVAGNDNIGGVVGSVDSSAISNCYNAGEVTGDTNVGGVAGQVQSNSTASNCYFLQTNSINDGLLAAGEGSSTACVVFDTNGYFVGGTGYYGRTNLLAALNVWTTYPTVTAPTGTTYSSWRTSQKYPVFSWQPFAWDDIVVTEFSGGDGTEGSPYQISNAAELAFLAYVINKNDVVYNNSSVYYMLTNDIYLNDTSQWESWATQNSELNLWTAIGNVTNKFQANFDGNGFSVFGVYINKIGIDSADNYQGLFGYASGASISNLGVQESYIKGILYAGGIAGRVISSTITDCYNTGYVTNAGNSDNFSYAGGIVGYAESSSNIANCYNTGDIISTVGNTEGVCFAGGIVAHISNSTITNCYNTGDVTSHVEIYANAYAAGGIVGNSYTSPITNCYNTGSVTGNDNVGGIVGNTNADTYNSYFLQTSSINAGLNASGAPDNPGIDCFAFDTSGNFVNSASVTIDGITATNVHIALNLWVVENQTDPRAYLYYQNMNIGTITGNNVPYAHTDVEQFLFTFNVNDGSGNVQYIYFGDGSYINLPSPLPTRNGYVLDGWYKEAGFVNQWNFDTDTVTANTTLYAKWLEIKKVYEYTITDSGTSFMALGKYDNSSTYIVSTDTIQNVIDAIKTDAAGEDCTIILGDGSTALDIVSGKISFSENWGQITLMGKVTSAEGGQGTIHINGADLVSYADISNTASFSSAVFINAGTASFLGGTIYANGLNSNTVYIKSNERIYFEGVTVSAAGIFSRAIYCDQGSVLDMSGCTVLADGGDDMYSSDSVGIYNHGGTVSIFNSTITALGIYATGICNIEYTIVGNIYGTTTLDNCIVTADEYYGTALFNYEGNNTFTIIDSDISANGEFGYAIYNRKGGNVTVSGGTISAIGENGSAVYNIPIDFADNGATNSGTLVFESAPEVNGEICAIAGKFSVAQSFNAGSNTYLINIFSPSTDAVAVVGGATQASKFILTNAGFCLKVSGSNLVVKISVTVSFNLNGVEGTAPPTQVVAYDDYASPPSTPPTKNGYSVKSWYKEASCVNQWNFATDKVITDTTLYAKWTLNAPTIDNYSADVLKPFDNLDSTLSITASHDISVSYTYQWFYKATSSSSYGLAISTATTNSYNVKNIADSGFYKVIVTASDGTQTSSAFHEFSVSIGKIDQSAIAFATTTDTVTYGDNANSYTITANVSGGNETGAVTYTLTDGGTGEGSLVDNVLTITKAGTFIFTATKAGDETYNISSPTTNTFTLTVNKADLTITASDVTVVYGGVLVPNGVTYSGFIAGESEASVGIFNGELDFSTNYQSTTNALASNIIITPLGISSANYNIIFVSGTINVQKASITVTANANQSKIVGENDPVLGYTITSGSLLNGDALSGSLARAAGEAAGEYDITVGTLNNPNYSITFVSEKFIVVSNYTIVFTSGGNGTVSAIIDGAEITSGTATLYGKTVVLMASPNTGYKIKSWTINGVSSGASAWQSIFVKSDLVVHVEFEQIPASSSQVPTPDSGYTISGVVVDSNDSLVEGAVVMLTKGNISYGTRMSGASGNFSFGGIASGRYNITAIMDGKTVIIEVVVADANATVLVKIPDLIIRSKIEIKENAPEIIVGKLSDVALDMQYLTDDEIEVLNNGGAAELKLTIQNATDSQIVAGTGKTLGLNVDIVITSTVTDKDGNEFNTSTVSTLSGLITISIPLNDESLGMNNYVVYRMHNGELQILTTTANSDGEYFELSDDGKEIILYVKNFSTYAVEFDTPAKPNKIPPAVIAVMILIFVIIVGLLTFAVVRDSINTKKKNIKATVPNENNNVKRSTKTHEQTNINEPTKITEPTELTEQPTEVIEPTELTEVIEPTELTEQPTEIAEPTKPDEPAEPAKPTEPSESTD